jgi:hypothetical protein
MNERIDELMIQAGARFEFLHGVHYDDFQYKKFAELIVKECIQACINEGKTFEVESAGEYSSNLYATAIKKHFGVEE